MEAKSPGKKVAKKVKKPRVQKDGRELAKKRAPFALVKKLIHDCEPEFLRALMETHGNIRKAAIIAGIPTEGILGVYAHIQRAPQFEKKVKLILKRFPQGSRVYPKRTAWKDPDILYQACLDCFKECEENKQPLTVEALRLFLGMHDYRNWKKLREDDDLGDVIEFAMLVIKNAARIESVTNYPNYGYVHMLKTQFGDVERQEVHQTGEITMNVKVIDTFDGGKPSGKKDKTDSGP